MIIKQMILYKENTPDKIIENLVNSQDRTISIPARIRLETGLHGEALENIYRNIYYKKLNDLYSLDNDLKEKLIAILLKCYPAHDVIASLYIDNKHFKIQDMPTGIMNMATAILSTNGYNYDDPLVCYHTIKQYEDSLASTYVMAERQYLMDKDVEKKTKNKTIADNILSDEQPLTNFKTHIDETEIEI